MSVVLEVGFLDGRLWDVEAYESRLRFLSLAIVSVVYLVPGSFGFSLGRCGGEFLAVFCMALRFWWLDSGRMEIFLDRLGAFSIGWTESARAARVS